MALRNLILINGKFELTLTFKYTQHVALTFLNSCHMIPKRMVMKGYIGIRHKPDLTAPGLISCSGSIFKRAKVGKDFRFQFFDLKVDFEVIAAI